MVRWLMPLLFLSACGASGSGEPAGTPRELQGVVWQATEIGGVPVLPKTRPSLRFERDGFSGHSTCNQFSGRNPIPEPGRIAISEYDSTLMGCVDPAGRDQEERYLRMLGRVTSYRLEADGGLSLLAPDGTSVRFRRQG